MKYLTKDKKGIALNQAFGAVLVLVLVAVLVIVAIIIFSSIGATFVNLETISVDNETITSVAETPQFVSQSANQNSTICNFASFGVTVTNSSSGLIINSPNYTITETGSIAVSGAISPVGELNNTDWNVTYSANWGGPSCVASNAMITQFATYPTLIGLVGTIIFLGLVIGVLVASFVFGGRKKEGF